MTELTLAEFRNRFSERTVDTSAGRWDIWGGRGAGTTMLFLPGAQGTGEVFFKPMLEFSDRHNAITATYPAESDAAVLVKGLTELISAEDLDPVILVGSSLGAYVAQRFAIAHPKQVSGLVVGNSFADATSVQATRYNPDTLKDMDPQRLKETMLGKLRDGPESELRSVLLDVMGNRQPAETLKARAMAVALSTPIKSVALPHERILVIDSAPDPVIGEEMQGTLTALYAGCAHRRIKDGTHYPYIVKYEDYAAALSAWLEGL